MSKVKKIFGLKYENYQGSRRYFLFFLKFWWVTIFMRTLEKKGQNDILFLMLFLFMVIRHFFCRRRKKKILICQSFFALDPLYKEPFTQLHRGATQSLKKGENSAIIMRWVFFAFLQYFSLIISKSLESNDLLKENSSNGASHLKRIFF